MQTVCAQCTLYNVPTLPKPLPPTHHSIKKKKVEKNEETMTVCVTENTFRSYIQLNKINDCVL